MNSTIFLHFEKKGASPSSISQNETLCKLNATPLNYTQLSQDSACISPRERSACVSPHVPCRRDLVSYEFPYLPGTVAKKAIHFTFQW